MAFFECINAIESSGKGAKVYSLGTGTASGNNVIYDIQSLLPDVDYTKLTASNFIVKIGGCSASASNSSSVLVGNSISVSCTPSLSYNNSTGLLTVSGIKGSNSKSQSGYTTNASITATVSDCYLIDGDIES